MLIFILLGRDAQLSSIVYLYIMCKCMRPLFYYYPTFVIMTDDDDDDDDEDDGDGGGGDGGGKVGRSSDRNKRQKGLSQARK